MFERAFDAYRSGKEEWIFYTKKLIEELREEANRCEEPVRGVLIRLANSLDEGNWREANELVNRLADLSLEYVRPRGRRQ